MREYSFGAGFMTLILLSGGVCATPLYMEVTVKSVSVIGRPGIDWSGVQVETVEPITGTACAPADVAKGFYFRIVTNASGIGVSRQYQTQALAA